MLIKKKNNFGVQVFLLDQIKLLVNHYKPSQRAHYDIRFFRIFIYDAKQKEKKY